MKQLLIMLTMVAAAGASAQPRIGGGFHSGGYSGGVHGGFARPRVTVIAPAPFYPYYGSGLGLGLGLGLGYSPFYNPYYGSSRYQSRPTQLDLQIEDIKNEYSYKISNVKDDKSLNRQQRKQMVKDLKHEKDNAIIDAKKNYYQELDNRRQNNNQQYNQQQ